MGWHKLTYLLPALVYFHGYREDAAAIIAEAYPGREVVMVDARPLFARGGGIHCTTQQEPRY